MANVIGELPQFTTEESAGNPNQKVITDTEVKEPLAEYPTEEILPEEGKETPAALPAEEKPAPVPSSEGTKGDDTEVKEVQGLLSEREKLLKEIVELRAKRREIREVETKEVITEVAEKLDDLNPDDVKNIERVLKAKRYVTKEETQKLLYKTVENDELQKFLDKYPEYKPENDLNDVNWNALQRELSFYKKPVNPKQTAEVLLRAHRNISGAITSVDRLVDTVQKRIATAQKGGGGVQRSSAGKSLPPNLRRAYEDGGWSETEIKELESNL